MIPAIVSFALRNRGPVLLLLLGLVIVGAHAFTQVPVEAYPDVSDTQVQIIGQWPGHAAEEVEQQLTLPVEVEMHGAPRLRSLRSTSIYGLSVVTLIFDEGTDTYFARQQVVERLRAVRAPEGVDPVLGPLSAPIGEIYRYTVRGDRPLSELKTLEDWTIERQLRQVPGVADVVSFGGTVKEYQVLVRPERLAAHDVTLKDVLEAIARSNRNAGGGFLEVGPQAVNVRGLGLLGSPKDLLDVPVQGEGKGRTLLRDVADVEVGYPPRLGVFALGDDDDVVQATVLMRKGENATAVLERVHAKVAEINGSGILPAGVRIEPYYDRTSLIRNTTRTVLKNLGEGMVLVAIVLLVLLGSPKSSAIVAIAIPTALLTAFLGMELSNVPANLLSIGAVDFGILVDGSVVMIENIYRRLAEREPHVSRIDAIRSAAQEMARPMVFSIGIITLGYLPIFTLQSTEGKLFRPMALTVAFALAGALTYALLGAPTIASFVLRGKVVERDNPLLRWRHRVYPAVLERLWRLRAFVIAGAVLVAVGGVLLARNVGSEFLPHLDEGAIWVRASMPANISLSEAKDLVPKMRRTLMAFPEATTVTSQVGRPDDGTDPTGFYNAEFSVQLKDAAEWRPEFHRDRERLVSAMAEKLSAFPGIDFGFSQPIADNVEEASSGVKGQMAVKIYGEDLKTLDELASGIEGAIKDVRGVEDLAVLRELGQTNLSIQIDRARAAQFGLDVADVEDVLEAGVAGHTATQVVEGERRVDVVVRMSESARSDVDSLKHLLVANKKDQLIPLGQVARVAFVDGAARIYRENGGRYVALKFSVRGRDLGGTVNDAQKEVTARVKVPEGYRVVWSGEFESQRRANARLAVVIPLTLVGIVVFLRWALGSMRDALVLLVNVLLTSPVGGVVALYATGTNFSVSAGVGFLALFGVSVQTGLILVSSIKALRAEGMELDEAVLTAARQRVRPMLMTSLVSTLGLLPAATSHAIGSDSQRPVAIVIVGGLLSSVILTLLVLPTLYRTVASVWHDRGRSRQEHETMAPPADDVPAE